MYICSICINDEYLKEEIRKTNKYAGKCTFCDSDEPCMELEELSDQIDQIINDEYEISDETVPKFVGDEDSPYYEPIGESIDYVIRKIIDLNDEIIDDIVEILRGKYFRDVADGGESFYHDGDNIVAKDFYNPLIHDNWLEFCQTIKHHQRFFSSDLNEDLRYFFSFIKEITFYRDKLIKKIPSETELYRARLINNDYEIPEIYNNPTQELGPPPPLICKANRLNPAGIPVFYGAFDRKTAIAEVRPHVGSKVISCIFKTKRELTTLNLHAADNGFQEISHFHPQYEQIVQQQNFLYFLQSEIRKPILPNETDMEFLPLQVLSEFLATQFDPKIDAIIYGSAQIKGGINIVVLNHALGNFPFLSLSASFPKTDISFLPDSDYAFIRYQSIHPSYKDYKPSLDYCEDSIKISMVNSVQYDTDDRIITLVPVD